MKSIRFLSLLLLLNLFAAGGYAADQPVKKEIVVSGVVTDTQKQPVTGVVVTDGVNFTQTDDKGRYQLVSDPAQSKFVYLSVPADYKTNVENALPVGYYARIDAKKKKNRCDFSLVKREQPVQDFTFIAISDPQARNEEQLDRFASETVVDLEETLKQLSSQEVYGMVLGDIVWDHFEHFPVYKKEMARLKIPFYPVIGNHDHDKEILSDKASAHTYEKYFGPAYYAFQLGKVYCIVLDNILYEGNKKYTEALTEEQIQWVGQLLKYLPENAPILIATHSPFYYADRGIIPGGEELFGILKNHPVSLISGHTHLNSNHEIKPGIIEHNIGAICGTWWTADENRDGTPNGYDVFEITGSEIDWFYKSVGHERNWQFKVFPRGTVKEKPNSVIAKVWNWDKKWQVKWYEDGAAKGAMQRFNGYDPDYLEYVGRLKTEKYTQPQESFFYFEATPSEKAREIEIEVTDRFGHIFPRQKVVLLPDK